MTEHEMKAVDLFFYAGLAVSKAEARRLIQQNGASVDGVKCRSVDDVITRQEGKEFVLLQKGKKVYLKVRFSR